MTSNRLHLRRCSPAETPPLFVAAPKRRKELLCAALRPWGWMRAEHAHNYAIGLTDCLARGMWGTTPRGQVSCLSSGDQRSSAFNFRNRLCNLPQSIPRRADEGAFDRRCRTLLECFRNCSALNKSKADSADFTQIPADKANKTRKRSAKISVISVLLLGG